MKTIEERIKDKGFKVLFKEKPLIVYAKGNERIVYHKPSNRIWGKYTLKGDKNENSDSNK